MKIALIGASGFVGTRLTSIIKNEHQVKIIDKNNSLFFPELTVLGDIRDFNVIKKELVGFDIVVLLAAEHKDDVTPTSLYYDVNVEGTKCVLEAMDKNGIKNIIFTSSVAIYGLNKLNPDESHKADPFNHYGKSKWQAEEVLREWYNKDQKNRSLTIIRPTVIFGERNRGNVYNLLSQIASKHFLMVGDGNNRKSMAYVGNIAALIKYFIDNPLNGYQVFNYVDKPDLTMNELVSQVEKSLGRSIPKLKLPYWFGMTGGLFMDLIARLSQKKLKISSVRIKKFCATTQFDSTAVHNSGFIPPYTLSEGLHNTLYYEFLDPQKDVIEFVSE